MAISDIEKMIAVGLIWGTTNALMRKGAIIWDLKSHKPSHSSQQSPPPLLHHRIILSLQTYLNLILTWQYSVPLFLNLSASASFFAILGHTPISLAVPVTNATTFAATAVMGMLLGERTRGTYLLLESTLAQHHPNLYIGHEFHPSRIQYCLRMWHELSIFAEQLQTQRKLRVLL